MTPKRQPRRIDFTVSSFIFVSGATKGLNSFCSAIAVRFCIGKIRKMGEGRKSESPEVRKFESPKDKKLGSQKDRKMDYYKPIGSTDSERRLMTLDS